MHIRRTSELHPGFLDRADLGISRSTKANVRSSRKRTSVAAQGRLLLARSDAEGALGPGAVRHHNPPLSARRPGPVAADYRDAMKNRITPESSRSTTSFSGGMPASAKSARKSSSERWKKKSHLASQW